MNKQEIYALLDEKRIWHEITEHEAVYNMAEVALIPLPYPEANAKNLFVRDHKKREYYLITVKGEKRVDLKEFKQKYQTRSLTFAYTEELQQILGLIPGAVTPMGLLNDDEKKVTFCIDSEFVGEGRMIGLHPNDNTATVWMKTEDLLSLIRGHGNAIRIVEI